jgi:antitoxin ParD1/3/4
MKLELTPDMQRYIEERVGSGAYASVEDVLRAGLATLMQYDQFPPGELERLLEEGEESIRQEGTLDFDEAHEARKARRAQRRNGK